MNPTVDWAALAPPLAVVVTALVVLVADLFVVRRRALLPALSLAGLGVGLGAVVALAAGDPRGTFCLDPRSCSYVADDFTLLLQGLLLLAGAGIVALSAPAVVEQRLPAGEYWFLLLVSLVGMLTMAAARDLVLLVLALEVTSLPTFVLAGLRRSDRRSAESALKFFLVSVIATAVMLQGMAMLYGATGHVQLDRLAAALGDADDPAARTPLVAAAVVLVLAGFGFKVSAAPFHAWAPDTYQGAPLPVAALLAVASKAAGFAGLLVVLLVGLPAYREVWGTALAVLAAVSMTLGNVVALQQRDVVRLLAWSGVAQTGYMLVPLAVGAAGRVPDLADLAAPTLSYLVVYVGMELGAFACVIAVARRTPRNALADYRGLARSSPLLAVALALFLTALAGLPPGLAGLFAKVVVFSAALDGGLLWLAVVMAVNTVIGLAYYLRLTALLFAGTGEARAAEPLAPAAVPRPVGVVIAVAAAAVVLVGFAPQLVLRVTPLAAALGLA